RVKPAAFRSRTLAGRPSSTRYSGPGIVVPVTSRSSTCSRSTPPGPGRGFDRVALTSAVTSATLGGGGGGVTTPATALDVPAASGLAVLGWWKTSMIGWRPPLYLAVMEWVPTPRAEVVNWARLSWLGPPVDFGDTVVNFVAPSRKVTWSVTKRSVPAVKSPPV